MATIYTVDAHAAGEPCRVVTAGLPQLRGPGIAECRSHFQTDYDWIRTALMYEPRGHRGMFGALLLSPERETSAFGLIFFDPVGYLDGCGHGTLCCVAVWHRLVGTSEVPFSVDNPDGSVTRVVAVQADAEGCSATLEMPPVEILEPTLPIHGLPDGAAGLARCGNTYLVVDAGAVGIDDLPSASPAHIREEATRVRNAVAADLEGGPRLPSGPASEWLEVALYQPHADLRSTHQRPAGGTGAGVILQDRIESASAMATAILFSDTQLDRSPCGTGSCALFGLLLARGEVAPERGLVTVGPLAGTFHLEPAGRDGGIEGSGQRWFRLTGTAYLTGVHEWIIGDSDRLRAGYCFE